MPATGEIMAVNTKMLYVIGPLQVQITVLTANSPVKSARRSLAFTISLAVITCHLHNLC